jgi:hypothetical protein
MKDRDPRKLPGAPSVQATPAPVGQPLSLLRPSQVQGLRRVPWKLVEVQDEGRRLIVVVSVGPLDASSLRGVVVSETPTEVEIIVYGTPLPQGFFVQVSVDVVCPVELADPLGSRRLLGADPR